MVKATERGRDKKEGVLRIDFPGGAGDESFESMDWDEWFQKCDDNDLAFLYQAQKADGSDSTFFKLVSRESAKS